MKNTVANMICKPFCVGEMTVTSHQIADAIDMLANIPHEFIAVDLAPAVLPGATLHQRQEALNRLFQRWRKLGLVSFKRGRWSLTRGSWVALQAKAMEARRAETPKSGSVHDSAIPKGFAQ